MGIEFSRIPQRPVNPLIDGIKIIDVDTHFTEPHDLWLNRAPAALKDRVPQVKIVDAATGKKSWFIDGDKSIGFGATAVSTVLPDGSRSRGAQFINWTIDDVHPAAWHVGERLKVMDACNIQAQILYPNVLGFGGQEGAKVDSELRLVSVQIYNDAMADMQDESGQRIFPMAMLPWWDAGLAVKEIERMAKRGLRGVNINTDPQTYPGLPDLADKHWDRMWAACRAHTMPINFHIGASSAQMDWVGDMPWPSQTMGMRMALGGVFLFFGNGRVMANLIASGLLDRYPELQFVSVESGIGWIPFLLEALDYQISEGEPGHTLKLAPSEYFARNFHGCFWFEKKNLAHSVRAVGIDRVMFETDFPHPTCNYPEGADYVMDGLAELTREERTKILSLNASKLYNIAI